MRPSPRPFLKWAGGKGRLVDEVLARFPSSFDGYCEPFLGGGAVFFELHRTAIAIDHRVVLADANRDLVACYVAVRDFPDQVVANLREMAKHTSREDYERVRAMDVGELASFERAARFIYLNRLCFNGLYRVNRAGKFNVPYGRYRNPRVLDEPNLRACSLALEGVTIVCGDAVRVAAVHARKDDLVYLDPPYDGAGSFAGFTAKGFRPADQNRLALLFRKLAARGATVVLSNADTPRVRELYRDFRIDPVTVGRSIAASGAKRARAREVLVRHPAL